jgi:hypothetical protein
MNTATGYILQEFPLHSVNRYHVAEFHFEGQFIGKQF